jgi:hypothetical protein
LRRRASSPAVHHGREGLFVAQRSDLLAADGGTTTIVDVSDLVPSG